MGFLDLLMDISKDDLHCPDESKEERSEGNCSNVDKKSPFEGSENRTREIVSVRSEVPDASDTCKHELTSGTDEGHMPEKGEKVEVPNISRKVSLKIKFFRLTLWSNPT
jgi:hypothetical protein